MSPWQGQCWGSAGAEPDHPCPRPEHPCPWPLCQAQAQAARRRRWADDAGHRVHCWAPGEGSASPPCWPLARAWHTGTGLWGAVEGEGTRFRVLLPPGMHCRCQVSPAEPQGACGICAGLQSQHCLDCCKSRERQGEKLLSFVFCGLCNWKQLQDTYIYSCIEEPKRLSGRSPVGT